MGRDALREDVRAAYEAALEAVAPGPALRRSLERTPPGEGVVADDAPVRILALGKAAPAMAEAAVDLVVAERRPQPGLVVAPGDLARPVPDCRVLTGGHPLPDASSLDAGRAVLELAEETGDDTLILLLLSGGASALAAVPEEGLGLSDKRAVTEALLRGGAPIDALNAVRKHLSALKGGRLAVRARPAAVDARLLSDVPTDDPALVGSGPTVGDETSWSHVAGALQRHAVADRVPEVVRRIVDGGVRGEREDTPDPDDPRLARSLVRLVAGNGHAVRAGADALYERGYRASIQGASLDGDARVAGEALHDRLVELRGGRDAPDRGALVAGGETTVEVGDAEGVGGRCQELAAAFALRAEQQGTPGGWSLLAAGTDGRDGPTDAAGALVDSDTLARARAAGRDPADDLARHDTHRLLDAADALVRTGPTGTNVADVVLLLWTA